MRRAQRLFSYAGAPVPYIPPEFAARVSAYAPSHRLILAMAPTPIHSWALPGLPPGVRVSVKRDDMTGSTAGGNKIRKLEFLLADAMREQAKAVITAGGLQSNHARATAVLCRELGLDCHVLLRSRDLSPSAAGFDGNVLLHKLVGAHIHLIKPAPYETGILPKMQVLARRLLRNSGKKAYLIGIGGSNEVGVWGYIEVFAELMRQGACEQFSDIVVPVGSGGTASGLAIGNYLAGSPVRVHAVGVCDSPDYFHDHVDGMLAKLGLQDEVTSREIIHIFDGKGRGYARSTEKELEFCVRVARDTGVVLDRVYTGKAVKQWWRKWRDEAHFEARILTCSLYTPAGYFPCLTARLSQSWSLQRFQLGLTDGNCDQLCLFLSRLWLGIRKVLHVLRFPL